MANPKVPTTPKSPSTLYRLDDGTGDPLYFDSLDELLADADEDDDGRPVAVYTLARNTKILCPKPRLK